MNGPSRLASSGRANPSNAVAARDVSSVYQRLGALLEHSGDYERSLEMSRKGLIVSERLFDADPANFEVRRDLMVLNGQLGRAYLRLTDYPAAEKALRTALDVASGLVAKNPGSERSRDDQAESAYLLGMCLAASERDQEALEDLKWSNRHLGQSAGQAPGFGPLQSENDARRGSDGRVARPPEKRVRGKRRISARLRSEPGTQQSGPPGSGRSRDADFLARRLSEISK